MFVGHYSVSFALKKAEVSIPLWKLFLAVQFIDIIWAIFVFLGLEKAEIDLHSLAASPLNLYYMPFTHSVLGALFWAIAVFTCTVVFSESKGPIRWKMAMIYSIAVFSHWVLDFIVHLNDLPLWANSYKAGIGLYQSAIGTFLVEIILLIAGVIIYFRAVRHHQKVTKIFLFFILFLIVLCWNSIWGIKPPTTNIAASFLLTCYLLTAFIIYLIEKKQRLRENSV
ncbi:hypothetical protein [Virgibacillus oceani]|uniref:Permease n=1 Tax=Virgibacillus oceani TaxID=1479511 RepID=A0A917HBF2_9BACI|nr:hypothetical protein [Virgibacillus oceani]GGG73852.1 hypothetical protein GCM10011398_17980 [Virgibacillus oceani]